MLDLSLIEAVAQFFPELDVNIIVTPWPVTLAPPLTARLLPSM